MLYSLFIDGVIYETFTAKSDLSAKRKVSRLCSLNPRFYSNLCGVRLFNVETKVEWFYSPFFYSWIKV